MRPAYSFSSIPYTPKLLKWILGVMLLCYILELLFMRFSAGILDTFAFIPQKIHAQYYLWTFITYAFLHNPSEPFHLLFNLLMLWWLGSAMFQRWGQKRFLLFFFGSAFAGALLTYLVSFSLSVFFPAIGIISSNTPVIGASAITTALLVAFGLTYPEQIIYFFFFPLKCKHLVLLMIGYEILTALAFNAVASTAHFGGIIFAAIMIYEWYRPKNLLYDIKKLFQRMQYLWLKRKLRYINSQKQEKDISKRYLH